MIVEGWEPAVPGARGLQVVVAQILGVAQAIVGQVVAIEPDMMPHLIHRQAVLVIVRPPLLIFVDEVTIMVDEGEIILVRQMAEGGEQAIFVILAARYAELQARGAGGGERQGAGAAARRLIAA